MALAFAAWLLLRLAACVSEEPSDLGLRRLTLASCGLNAEDAEALVAALEAATRRGGAEAFARDRGSETKARGVRAVFDDVGPVPTTPTGRDGRRNE